MTVAHVHLTGLRAVLARKHSETTMAQRGPGQQSLRSERSVDAHDRFMDELEVSMLLEAHEAAKKQIGRSEEQKSVTAKMKAKHGS